MNRKRVQIDNLSIEYIALGEGDDLLFLHGGSVSFRTNLPFLEELSKHFRVWAFSFPGAGKSSNLPKGWKFEDYVKIVNGFVTKVGIRPILCGHSIGGAIAIKVAATFPRSFNKIVLLSPAGLKERNPQKRPKGSVRSANCSVKV